MKKYAPLILILLVMVFVLLATSTPLKVKLFGIQPSYKWKQGQSQSYSLVTNLSMKTHMQNVPEEMEKNFPIKEMEAKITQKIDSKVDSMEGNLSVISFTGRIEDMSLSVNGTSADELIKTGTETSVLLKVAPTGEIITGEKGDATAPEKALMISSLAITQLLRLPDKVIKPGQQWKQKLDLTLSPGASIMNISGDVDYKFEELTKTNNRYHMVISFKGNLSPGGSGDSPVTLKGNTAFEGKYWFDIEKGIMTKARNKMDIETSLQMKGILGKALEISPIKISPKSTITIELDIK